MTQSSPMTHLARLGPWADRPAAQQPDWHEHPAHPWARERLASAPPLVTPTEIRQLRATLARLTETGSLLLQLGDCAESFHECTPPHVARKLRVLDLLADRLGELTGSDVVRVGRMGGQFAKPRSQLTEPYGASTLPSFRGHLINAESPDPAARRPDPARMVRAHDLAATVHRAMRTHRERDGRPAEGPWSSHEALVLDYESPLLRQDPGTDAPYLSSTHLPWVGERTRRPGDAHVALLASVVNPVGCKIGPDARPEDVLRVCEALDPRREPGRLVLIPRMGRDRITRSLPPLVRLVANAGHPAIWLCDPMHGNTVRSRTGLKTRHLTDVVTEAVRFRDILDGHGQHAAGLHLEVAADEVTECVGASVRGEDQLPHRYTSLCDPRLNPEQAVELVEAWAKGALPGPS
ncbi:3-deoxy-7-phosphoheptulonate synthase [Streptomyces sp. NPDC058739]|uniref:3-deoxy-7-phosphoheptulonate synthase n=1 Tax=Streptomyces sp. NPDC058739 TaxID=3346618 RepID=UPI0036BCAAAD